MEDQEDEVICQSFYTCFVQDIGYESTFATQIVVHGLAGSALSESLLEIQNIGPHCRPTKMKSTF